MVSQSDRLIEPTSNGPCNSEGEGPKEYYVDHGLLRTLKEHVQSPDLGQRLFLIQGDGGTGKSETLAQFGEFCRQQSPSIPFGCWNGGTGGTVNDVLRKLSAQLAGAGVSLASFQRSLAEYEEILAKDNQARDERKKRIEDLVKAGGEISKEVMKALVPEMVTPVVAGGVEFTAGLIKSALAKKDNELLLRPEEKLIERFAEDVRRVASGRPLVLAFDAYEKMAALDNWLCELVRRLDSTNIFVVIAGRVPPGETWNDYWPGWSAVATTWPRLGPFDDDIMREIINRRCIFKEVDQPDPAQIERLIRFARGLPMAATVAVDLHAGRGLTGFNFDRVRVDVVQALVDNIRRGLPDDLRELIEAAAVVRRFDRDLLSSLVGAELVDRCYDELARLSYVEKSEDALNIHDRMREWFLDYIKFPAYSRLKFKGMTEKAIAYYQKALEVLGGGADVTKERHRLTQEILYHKFQLSNSNGLEFLRKVFEEEFERRQFGFCQSLLRDARAMRPGSGGRSGGAESYLVGDWNWLTFYEAKIAHYSANNAKQSSRILEGLLDQSDLELALRVAAMEYLASLCWYYRLHDQSGTVEAEQLYQKCLDLYRANGDTAGQARILTWLGIWHQRVRGAGESYFRDALKLDKSAWAERELSIALRMRGQFDEAETLITSSKRTFNKFRYTFEEAHSELNLAMLMVFRGRLREAEESFERTIKLFKHCNATGAYEQAWPRHGLGDVALGRGRLDQARKHYCESGRYWKGDRFGIAVTLGSRAAIYLEQGRYDDADRLAGKALEWNIGAQDTFGQGWTLHNKGLALLGLGRVPDAKECLRSGLQRMKEYGSWYGQSLLTLGLCRAYLAGGEWPQFERAARAVRKLATNRGFHDHFAWLFFLRARASLGDWAQDKRHEANASLDSRIIPCFANALEHALAHNIFLLDRIAREICEVLRSLVVSSNARAAVARRNILAGLRDRWQKGTIDDTPLWRRERTERSIENDPDHAANLLTLLGD